MFSDVEYQCSLVKREPGQSDEDLAKVLYLTQMEVLSANAGRDLITNNPADPFLWENLKKETRQGWLDHAKSIK